MSAVIVTTMVMVYLWMLHASCWQGKEHTGCKLTRGWLPNLKKKLNIQCTSRTSLWMSPKDWFCLCCNTLFAVSLVVQFLAGPWCLVQISWSSWVDLFHSGCVSTSRKGISRVATALCRRDASVVPQYHTWYATLSGTSFLLQESGAVSGYDHRA